MSANAEATTLEERPRVRPRVRSQVASQSEERRDQDAVAIGSLYRKGREAIVDGVRYYLQAGRKLIQKKDSCPMANGCHGCGPTPMCSGLSIERPRGGS